LADRVQHALRSPECRLIVVADQCRLQPDGDARDIAREHRVITLRNEEEVGFALFSEQTRDRLHADGVANLPGARADVGGIRFLDVLRDVLELEQVEDLQRDSGAAHI
jgi:hypothetical protein